MTRERKLLGRFLEAFVLLVGTSVGIATGNPWLMIGSLVLGYFFIAMFTLFTSGD